MKKYKLSKIADKEFYHDEYGWVTPEITMRINGYVNTEKRGDYKSRTGKYEIISEKKTVQDLDINAVYTSLSHDYYGGARGTTISDLKLTRLQMLEREWEKEKLYCRAESYNYYGDLTRKSCPIEDMKVKFFWGDKAVTKDTEVEAYVGAKKQRMLWVHEIKEGLRVQYGDQGTFVVTKVFDQPNKEDKLCVIERLIKKEGQENSFEIILNQQRLVTVPYEKYDEKPDELAVFNQPLKEIDLAAFCEFEAGSANLYWQPLAEARGYTVSLYKKYFDNSTLYKHEIYLLEQYSVERNRCWFTINNLIGSNYFVIIEAEDRSGAVIARTRGIKIVKGTNAPKWIEG